METEQHDAVGLGRDDWLKAIGGALFFVAGLLAWWELRSESGFAVTDNAFDFVLTGMVPYVIFVGIGIVTILIRTGSLRLPDAFVHPVLSLGAASLGTVLLAIRFFVDGFPALDDSPSRVTIERGIGLYLAAVAALLVLAGCILSYREYRAQDVDDGDDSWPADATEHPPAGPPSTPPLP